MTGTFKKLSYERKLGLSCLVLKNIFTSEFQIKQIEEVI